MDLLRISALITASIVFACCFGAGLLGLFLHRVVPDQHLNADSKDTVKLVMGLIATMAALVLSLLIASAKTSYDAQKTALQQLATDAIELDQRLANFGADTIPVRQDIRQTIEDTHNRVWLRDGVQLAALDPSVTTPERDVVVDGIHALTPRTDSQRNDVTAALVLVSRINHTRLLMFVEASGAISVPFLVILVLWVATLYLGFGLFASLNATVVVAMAVGAVCVSTAIFLILELNSPYSGLMRLSDAPVLYALAHVGQ